MLKVIISVAIFVTFVDRGKKEIDGFVWNVLLIFVLIVTLKNMKIAQRSDAIL